MSGLTKSLYATTPLMAEALGLIEALAFAGNLGIRLLEVDNDCLELVQACKNEINRMEIFSILTDINFLKRNFHDLTCVQKCSSFILGLEPSTMSTSFDC